MVAGIRRKPKPRQIVVGMPYPGGVISVNHYKGRRKDGREYVKSDARSWMEMLGWLIKTEHIEEWALPLHVTCSGTFRSENEAPDLSNLSKCTLDAIEEVTGLNDRDFRWHDGDRVIDAGNRPELTITIEESKS
jgi:hypothetical protein